MKDNFNKFKKNKKKNWRSKKLKCFKKINKNKFKIKTKKNKNNNNKSKKMHLKINYIKPSI